MRYAKESSVFMVRQSGAPVSGSGLDVAPCLGLPERETVALTVAGRYFDYHLGFCEGSPAVWIANAITPEIGDIHRDDAWRRRLELHAVFDEFPPGFEPLRTAFRRSGFFRILNLSYATAFPDVPVSEGRVMGVAARNSQDRFDAVVQRYANGEIYDSSKYAVHGPASCGYEHTAHFGWIYWHQILAIRKVLDAAAAGSAPVTVVDLATGYGHFLLTAWRFLSSHPRAHLLRFVGIDRNTEDMEFGRQMARGASCPAEFCMDDLMSSGFACRLMSMRPDVIVANHIVEHLPGPIENYYLHDWLLAARRCLSLSVPLCDEPFVELCGHYHKFEPESVARLGASMEMRVGHAARVSAESSSKDMGLITFDRIQEFASRHVATRVLSLYPHPVEAPRHEILEDFCKPFDPSLFLRKMRAPKIGQIEATREFSRQGDEPRQVRQLPIKFPGTAVKLPVEFHQFREAVQLIVNHNRAVNSWYEDYYAYLNVFRGLTRFDSYRGLSLSCHGDQLQGLQEEYWYSPDYSYIVSSTLPTTFYAQPFDISELLERFRLGERVNLYDAMNAQAHEENAYYSENFGIYLLSPYIVHSASQSEHDVHRVFLKVAFSSKRFFDNRELRQNPAFDYEDWYFEETIGHTDGWLQHGHFNERFIKRDIVRLDEIETS